MSRADEPAPASRHLDDAFHLPVALPTQRREDLVHSTFDARVRREGRSATVVADVALRWDAKRRSEVRRGGPWMLKVWRRVRATFEQVYAGDGPCFSRELGAWIVAVGDKLRVANDRAGKDLWPAVDEEHTVAEAEVARAARATKRAAAKVRAEARDVEERARAAEARAREEAAQRAAMEAKLAAPKKGWKRGSKG